MDIKINPQSPDGLNITIENLVVDTYEEALEIIEMIDEHNSKKKYNIIKDDINNPTIKWNDYKKIKWNDYKKNE